MTEQEAINVFKGFKFTPREMKAVALGIEALEKQIPKKPSTRLTSGALQYEVHDCPICGEHFGFRTDVNYCEVCGQKIDWSDEDDREY